MIIKPIGKAVYFSFIQSISSKSFDNVTDWGFQIKNPTKDLDKARWAVVEDIGDTVTDVVVGDYILIQPLMWTNSVDLGDRTFWKTSEEHIMAKTQVKPTDLI